MEIGDKDIYEYIVGLADDRVVINMLSVNKKFNDDSYFKKILKNRYPLLLQFQEDNETYRHLYLRMVKYISKLWEKYKMPYIPHKSFNPEYMYSLFSMYPVNKVYTLALHDAVKIGDIKLIKYLIGKGATINELTYGSIRDVDTLKFFLNNYSGPRKWLENLLFYARVKNIKSLKDFLEKLGIKEK